MIEKRRKIVLLVLLGLLSLPIYPQESKYRVKIDKDISVRVERLSHNVLALADISPNGNVTAISTKKGVVVVDTGVSWSFGKRFRNTIEREFRRNDFSHIINTHADRDHTFGNQAFTDALIIAHDNCRKSLQILKSDWNLKRNEYVLLHKERAIKNITEMEEMALDFAEVEIKRQSVAINNLIASDLAKGQEISLPSVTFNDRFTLDCGDMVLYLYYLGRGHSDADILVYVPQEKLIIAGDTFMKSMLICYMKEDVFDVVRYSEILNKVLTDQSGIVHVVCGHGASMTGDELSIRLDYLKSLMKSVKQAYDAGRDLKSVIRRLPLEHHMRLVNLLGRPPAELSEQHNEIITKYWSMLHREESEEK